MKKRALFLLFLAFAVFSFTNCDLKDSDGAGDDNPLEVDEEKSDSIATFTGQVVEENGEGLENAIIRVIDGSNQKSAVTDSAGGYSLKIGVEENRKVWFIADKEGFRPDTSFVYAIINRVVEMPVIVLSPEQDKVVGNSGGASSIYVDQQSAESVGVSESGSKETAEITFQIEDSLGNPIDIHNQVEVNFSLSSQPNGGEFINPTIVKSNALGKATVVFSAGTKAGVAQLLATITTDDRTIVSKPVVITVHGGLPDPGHFHVACEKLNYPALGVVGFEIPFTAYVGDKYSNPVRENTAVYFDATSGIIQGSALTGPLGTGSVSLLTQPWPNHPTHGPGFFTVTARTVDEDSNEITTTTKRLLSGAAILTVNPTSVNIPDKGSQSFSYVLRDVNNNPLSEGTTVSVNIEGAQVGVAGDAQVQLPDTQSGWKNFSFTVFDEEVDTLRSRPVKITISTSGANGDQTIILSGTAK